MWISRGTALMISALVFGAMVVPGGAAFSAEEAKAAAEAPAKAETRKPDVVLNSGAGEKAAAEKAQDEVAEADTGESKPSGEEAAEPYVENEGDGAKPRKPAGEGDNIAGMRAREAGDSKTNAGKDAESAAEEAAMTEAAKITKEEAEKPASQVKLEPTLFINIDLAKQRMTVSEGDKVLYTWAVSSGRYGYPTPTGTFNPVWMTKMWYSRQYDNAPMPHSIFFSGGAAIHATSYTRQLGMPASHGCVRLSPRNAETLFKLVTQHGKGKTQIVVHGTPNYQVAERRDRRYSDRYAYRYEYGEPSRYAREAPEWSYKRRYSTYYGTPPRYRREYRDYGYRPRGMFSSNSGYYGYGY